MLAFFRTFLIDALGIEPDEIVMSINVYTNNGMTIDEIERYWLDLLDLPRARSEAHAQPHADVEQRTREEQAAVRSRARLSVHSTRMVQHIYGAIQEYAGFDEPRGWTEPTDGPGCAIIWLGPRSSMARASGF